MRSRVLRLVTAIALVAGTAHLFLTPAQADVGTPTSDALIAIRWGETTDLTWDGQTRVTATGTFIGSHVSVPGDRVQSTAFVKNAGPSNALVAVQIVNVTTINAPDTVNTELEDLIHLFWRINGRTGEAIWKDLRLARDANGVSHSVGFCVPKNEEFPVTVGYYFPTAATTGKNLGQTSSTLEFDLRITMQAAVDGQCDRPGNDDPPGDDKKPDDEINPGGTISSGGTTLNRLTPLMVGAIFLMLGICCVAIRRVTRRRTPRPHQ